MAVSRRSFLGAGAAAMWGGAIAAATASPPRPGLIFSVPLTHEPHEAPQAVEQQGAQQPPLQQPAAQAVAAREGAADNPGEDGSAPRASPDAIRCLDYGLSFVCGTASFNCVRFWVESRTTLFDQAAGTARVFYQCASCKSENTFAEKDLFIEDNYDFLPILGDGQWLIFRRPARISPTYRQVRTEAQMWGAMNLRLREASPVTVLKTWEQIRDATAAGLPLVSQTKIACADTGLHAVIECPVKTMNISLDKQMYQVDTGPVALPDLTRRYDPPIESLRLAFIAFNSSHFADFVVEQPTPVVEDGQEKCQMYHYCGPFSLPAENVLLAVG
jgi:hypothetical protein